MSPHRDKKSPITALRRREFLMPCSPVSASILYPCDLTDAEWTLLAPLLPAPARCGRPRSWPLRLLVNALFYVLRTGCAWRYLPREYLPGQTASTTFRQWRLHGVWQCVHEALRRAGVSAAEAVFAIARTAGWIAHALEEYQRGTPLRPRAVYTGPLPGQLPTGQPAR